MQGPEVSVIMPIYNSRKEELATAVQSVLKQTLANVELICVDDGSTDDTFDRLDRYARSDGRIRIVRMPKNAGTLVARNAGILAAAGRYVLPLDPDDALDPRACEVLSAKMTDSGLDMLQYAVETVSESFARTCNPIREEIVSSEQFTNDVFVRRCCGCGVIAKIFRRDLLASAASGLPAGYCTYGEDGILLMKFLALGRRIGTFPVPLYHYGFGCGISTQSRASCTHATRIARSIGYVFSALAEDPTRAAVAYCEHILHSTVGSILFARCGVAGRIGLLRSVARIVGTRKTVKAITDFSPAKSTLSGLLLAMRLAFVRTGRRRRKLVRKAGLSHRIRNSVAELRRIYPTGCDCSKVEFPENLK